MKTAYVGSYVLLVERPVNSPSIAEKNSKQGYITHLMNLKFPCVTSKFIESKSLFKNRGISDAII